MWVHNCIVYTVVTYSSIHLILYILVDEIVISLYSLYITSSSYRLANIQCKCIHCVFHVYYSLFLILKGKFTDSQPTLYRYNIGISKRTMCIIFTCHLHQEIRQTSVGWHKTCHLTALGLLYKNYRSYYFRIFVSRSRIIWSSPMHYGCCSFPTSFFSLWPGFAFLLHR